MRISPQQPSTAGRAAAALALGRGRPADRGRSHREKSISTLETQTF